MSEERNEGKRSDNYISVSRKNTLMHFWRKAI